MFYIIITFVLLAVFIWLIARYKYKQKSPSKKLQIVQEISLSYDLRMEEYNKKKKNKKKKIKGKKSSLETQVIEQQVVNGDNRQIQVQQNQKQDIENLIQSKITQNNPSPYKQDQKISPHIQKQTNNQANTINIPKLQMDLIKKAINEAQYRKQLIFQQLQYIKNYFLLDFIEIVPYNGQNGHYKLILEGTKKSIVIQWKYNNLYPQQQPNIQIFKQTLNPLQNQKLQNIIQSVKLQKQMQELYHYIFNLTTSIYQDLMMNTNLCIVQEDEIQNQKYPVQGINQNFDLTKPHHKPEEIMVKKQIYDKILDQIFYLHDLVQKPENNSSIMNAPQESINKNKNSSRGRYQSQFEELQLIGQGGFGKVYRVKHLLDQTIYAVKKTIINYDDPDDKKMLKQVNLLSKLNHPNIVRYYQSWMQDTNSMQQLLADISFSEDQKTKIGQLQNIYSKWKSKNEEIAFEKSNNNSEDSYNGSIVYNDDIVFGYEQQQNDDIAFQDDNEQMNVSDSSQIDYADHNDKNQSDSSIMNHLKGFPFKILYIVMEFCSGINLRQFINNKFNQEDQKISILRGLLEGLAYIHSKKIIHRDLKPANVFLTEHSKVKIGDFGIATTQQRSMSICLEFNQSHNIGDKTQAVGTRFYRAPQQLNRNYNEKVDIYSFGIVMFELFYPFKTDMERLQVLKELTQSQKLPKDFVVKHAETDILQNITVCLQQHPEERPSASKLLQSFRNKYFSQLVSCIANPKHFQFSQLLAQLFQIKNQYGTLLMRRDAYKSYATTKLQKIYKIHRATHFPTLPMIPIQDFNFLNGQKLKLNNRNHKYTLLTNKGNILQYSDNCLKSWLKYAKDAMRKKKTLEDQMEPIKRYTFQKVIKQQSQAKKQNLQLEYCQKMVSAFDITYKFQYYFKLFYFCQALKVSQAIILTLNLTQKRPPIYISHSLVYKLLAQKYKIPKDILYNVLLSINQEQFYSLPSIKKISYLQQKNLPANFSKKLGNMIDMIFPSGKDLLQQLELSKESQLYQQICYQMQEIERVKKDDKNYTILQNEIRWRLGIPQSNCCGLFWQVGIVKGTTSIQQYSPGQSFCNYHIQINLDADIQQADVSIWCIGDYLQEEMHKFIFECWKNGLKTRWYQQQMGEKEDRSRYNILIKKKNGKVQIMLRNNEYKQQKSSSSFIPIEHFDINVIKQLSNSSISLNFH